MLSEIKQKEAIILHFDKLSSEYLFICISTLVPPPSSLPTSPTSPPIFKGSSGSVRSPLRNQLSLSHHVKAGPRPSCPPCQNKIFKYAFLGVKTQFPIVCMYACLLQFYGRVLRLH